MLTSYLGSLGVKIGIVAAIVVGLLLYRASLIHRIDTVQLAATRANAQLIAERANEATLQAALTKQNDALAALAQSEATAKAAQLATEARIKQEEAQMDAHTHSLLVAKVGSTCSEAIKWANLQARSLSAY